MIARRTDVASTPLRQSGLAGKPAILLIAGLPPCLRVGASARRMKCNQENHPCPSNSPARRFSRE